MQDTCEKLGRLFGNGVKRIVVSFIGEEAADGGGPLREFFSLIFDETKKFIMCTGNGTTFTLLHDIEKVRRGEHRLFGQFIAAALLQGCSGPRCFMPCLLANLLNSTVVPASLDEIPDIDVQEKLRSILESKSEGDFHFLTDSTLVLPS